jgi:RimJ/RimL family protein N-acetyltransferase
LERDFDPSLFDYYPKPYSSARDFVEENLEMQLKGNYLPFVIILKAVGEAIGCTEFSAIDEKNRKLEIGGSWLKRAFHGTAANSEAKFLPLRHAIETLEFVRVQFTANVLNTQSRFGIEKIGGRFEGVLRNAMILPDGTLRDDAYYSIVAKEWAEVRDSLRRRIQGKLAASLVIGDVSV